MDPIIGLRKTTVFGDLTHKRLNKHTPIFAHHKNSRLTPPFRKLTAMCSKMRSFTSSQGRMMKTPNTPATEIPIFPAKYHQDSGLSMAVLVYR